MKKYLVICLMLVFLVSVVSAAEKADYILEPKLKVNLVRLSPSYIQRGSEVELFFRVESYNENVNLNNVRVYFTEKNPFYLAENENSLRVFNEIKSGQSAYFSYKIKVSDSAQEGSNAFSINFEIGGFNKIFTSKFDVSVNVADQIIEIDKVRTDPERLVPGQEGKLYINLGNAGDSVMEDIRVKLDFNQAPITPLYSTNEMRIKKLDLNENAELTFDLIVDSNAESKAYKIPIDVTYYDKLGNKLNKNGTIGIIVDYKPELEVGIAETEIYQKNKNGKITLSISNTGASNIKFLSVELKETKDYKVIDVNKQYIGNLDSDDFETAEFNVYVNNVKGDVVKLKVLLSYKNAFNENIVEEREIPLRLYSSRDAAKFGLVKQSNFVGIIIIIIIIIFAYAVIRKWRKERNFEKAVKDVVLGSFRFVFRKKKRKP